MVYTLKVYDPNAEVKESIFVLRPNELQHAQRNGFLSIAIELLVTPWCYRVGSVFYEQARRTVITGTEGEMFIPGQTYSGHGIMVKILKSKKLWFCTVYSVEITFQRRVIYSSILEGKLIKYLTGKKQYDG